MVTDDFMMSEFKKQKLINETKHIDIISEAKHQDIINEAKQYTIDDLILRLRCPLGGKLFLKPVLANNGKVYEEMELINHIYTNNELGLNSNYIDVLPIQSLVNFMVEKYPDLKNERFKFDESKFKNNFILNIKKIKMEIDNGNYDYLLNYDKIYMVNLEYKYYINILSYAPLNITKHVIQHTVDINENIINNGLSWPLLNHCLKSKNKNIVKSLLDYNKDININSTCPGDGWTVGHQTFHYGFDLDMIKRMIKLGMKLDIQNKDGYIPITYCCKKSTPDIIEYIFEMTSKIHPSITETLISGIYENKNLNSDQKEK